MQPGCEHRRSGSKRVLRRGSAEIRAPWIGPPTMANGPLPLESHRSNGHRKIRTRDTTQIGLALFLVEASRSAGARRFGELSLCATANSPNLSGYGATTAPAPELH